MLTLTSSLILIRSSTPISGFRTRPRSLEEVEVRVDGEVKVWANHDPHTEVEIDVAVGVG